ncbi:CarD family transcriptional regulator [Lachnobacterium bovis]|uniref:CarD-like/TRCF domain-containing protein n=1 Tax=Lachnobacterium bovis TaxID=140626 RepID=A0A1H9UQR6_9FIRM|nr:CarD family transcriptional regulator [Lachnobacterium bovis]SES11825.1 CarD-like/TRCF domain-containing protein [Lachnobacterium bovis]
MFQKKQYIYSETQGVCQVDNIVSLKTKKRAPIQYYVLKPVYEPQTISYIPVEGHKVELKELFTPEEARELENSELAKKDVKVQDAIDFVLQREKGKDGARNK